MKELKLIVDEFGDLTFPEPTVPNRKHDFTKAGWRFYMEEGIMHSPKEKFAQWLGLCPRSGRLMFLEEEDIGAWVTLPDDLQKAYKKWAIKQAEKALLGK